MFISINYDNDIKVFLAVDSLTSVFSSWCTYRSIKMFRQGNLNAAIKIQLKSYQNFQYLSINDT